MLGIKGIGVYIPKKRIDAFSFMEKFSVSEEFINEKTGFTTLARKNEDETTTGMCVNAFQNYCKQNPELKAEDFDFICVCTQNADSNVPQTAAKLQARLGLSQKSAGFDISLGCSGYAYGLAVAMSFMEKTNLKNGLLFTCDPYSSHISPDDKNMQLLFGDAATVTHITSNPVLFAEHFSFETLGEQSEVLYSDSDGIIHMDGRAVFNFALRNVTRHVKNMQIINPNIDLYLLHQGSRFMLDMVRKSLYLELKKVPFLATLYGNTVSSSIPLLLREYIEDSSMQTFAICGFGVGLSISSAILRRNNNEN